tara:strand:- start:569 stop:856 length:288 start_codon:yes stop_codon:yes gene_type:complete
MNARTGSVAGLVVSDKHADCNSCAHFFITWNKRFPYGCRAMGFMSSNSPSKDVFEVEGRDCLAYKNKFPQFGEHEGFKNKNTGGKGRKYEVNVVV